jgi:peptidoglycan/xylan/chitin deacetylase (PgdA/CDA1 family)
LPRTTALTVICDDGATRDLEVLEVLEQHGAKGVIAVCPEQIGKPGFLGYEQLRRMRAAGHEIAFHGATDAPLPAFGDAPRLRVALASGLSQLQAEGLDQTRTLVYPAGWNNGWVRGAAAELFGCAFTTWYGLNQRRANRYAIRRIPFGAFTPGHANESWYCKLIDEAAAGPCWPTLMLHPGESDHGPSHNALLSRLLAYAKGRGVPVRTASAHLAAAGGGV